MTDHSDHYVTCPDCGGTWYRKTGKVPAKGTVHHRWCTTTAKVPHGA